MRQFLFSICIFFAALCSASPQITSYFSPQDELAKHLIEQIQKEHKSIYIAVYTFTHQGIAKALIEAKKRGVYVEVIIDPSTAKRRAITLLRKAEVPLFVHAPSHPLPAKRNMTPLMHHKFCVLGQGAVWTGSFNFTQGALFNDENALLVHDVKLAEEYRQQFRFLRQKGSLSIEQFLASQK